MRRRRAIKRVVVSFLRGCEYEIYHLDGTRKLQPEHLMKDCDLLAVPGVTSIWRRYASCRRPASDWGSKGRQFKSAQPDSRRCQAAAGLAASPLYAAQVVHIAILANGLPYGTAFGGARRQAHAWAKQLSMRHRVTVFTPLDYPNQPEVESLDGFTVVRKGRQWKPVVLRRLVPAALGVLRHIASLQPQPDIILCFNTPTAGVIGTFVGGLLRIPTAVWIRGETEYRLRTRRFMFRAIVPWVWTRAAGVFVQTELGCEQLLCEVRLACPRREHALRGKLVPIGNGITLPHVTPYQPDGPVVTAGRLVTAKGMDTVIKACALARRPLVIAGTGPSREALVRQCSELAVNAEFAGFLQEHALSDLYRRASVVVLASRHEGLPNVVLEGMAHARPVVAASVGGLADVIQDGLNGLLVPPDDAHSLAVALDRLEKNPVLAAHFGQSGRATVEQFAWDRMMPKLEAALERCLARRTSGPSNR